MNMQQFIFYLPMANDQLGPNKKYVWFQLSHHPYLTPNPKLFLTFKWLDFYLLWDQPTQPGYMMLSHSTLFVRGYFKAWLAIELKRHVSKMKEKDPWATVAHFSISVCLYMYTYWWNKHYQIVQMGGFQLKVKCNPPWLYHSW